MDIFDTCSIKAIKKNILVDLVKQKKREICISTVSILELLCHLNNNFGENFLRQRGNILKLEYCEILDDPFASLSIRLGIENITNPNRFFDKPLLKKLIIALKKAENIENFYNQKIYHCNSWYSLQDCVERTKNALEFEERKFKNVLEADLLSIKKRLKEEYCKEFKDITDEVFYRLSIDFCRNIKDEYVKKDKISEEGLMERITNSMLVYYGYFLKRLCFYAENLKNFDVLDIKNFQKNDTEDSWIALYLDAIQENILVTEDKVFYNTISYTLEILKKHGMLPKCKVMSLKEYFEIF